MGEREPRRIGEAAGRAMHHLCHHRKRANGAGADARHEQQLSEILRAAIGRRSKRAVQAAQDHITRPYIVMRRHDEMRQQWCGGRRRIDGFPLDTQARALERAATGPSLPAHIAEEFERSHEYGGRSVFGWEPPPEAPAVATPARPAQNRR